MITVFLSPDGTHDMGHYVLVVANTGVVYATQCGGLLTDERSAEGFLVTVGPSSNVKALVAHAEKCTQAYGQVESDRWDLKDVNELARLIGEVDCWQRGADGRDTPGTLALDRSRLGECFEAWIPVVTPFGRGYFLGPNSD